MIPSTHKTALLSKFTSRQNKLWLAIGWIHRARWFLEYRWAGAYMRSRMQFRFEPAGEWYTADSYDEDIVPTLKFGKEGK